MPTISKEKLQDVFNWLRQHNVQFNVAKMHRQFSDCVPVATLLKKLHPRLIDLHNYPPQNSIRLKLANWETLNAKALMKLGLHQSKTSLENLAKGSVGSIENLLLSIMMNERAIKEKKEHDLLNAKKMDNLIMKDEQIILIVVNKKIGDAIVQAPQQMVLYSLYEKAMKAVEEKTKILKTVENEVANLEQDIQRQRNRIKDLSNQEKNIPETGIKLRTTDIIYLLEAINLRRLRNEFLDSVSGRQEKAIVPPLLLDDDITPRPPMSVIETARTVTSSSRGAKTLTPMPTPTPNNNKSKNTFAIPKTSFKRKFKPTKIPTRNGQTLKTEREKLAKQLSIQTLNESITNKSTKSNISDATRKSVNTNGSQYEKASLTKSLHSTATTATKKSTRESSTHSQTELPPKIHKAKTRLALLMQSARKTATEKPLTGKTEVFKKSNTHAKGTKPNSILKPVASFTPTTTREASMPVRPMKPKSELINHNFQVKSTIKKIMNNNEFLKSVPPLTESATKIPQPSKFHKNTNNNSNNNNKYNNNINNINVTKIPKPTSGNSNIMTNSNNINHNQKIAKAATTMLATPKESISKKNQKEKDPSKPSVPAKKLILSFVRKH